MLTAHKLHLLLAGLAVWVLVSIWLGYKIGRFMRPAPRLFGFTLPERFR